MGHGQIFQQDNDPQMNIIEQNQTKTGSLRKKQTKLQLWPSQSSDLNPIDNEWGELNWTEEKKHMELGI